MIIASQKVKKRFGEIKGKKMPKKCTYTHENCFDHKQYKVVSLEEMKYIPIQNNMRASFFDLVLKFTKFEIWKRDSQS
jgi:hypothetical protein